jgi:hypothetical protein
MVVLPCLERKKLHTKILSKYTNAADNKKTNEEVLYLVCCDDRICTSGLIR